MVSLFGGGAGPGGHFVDGGVLEAELEFLVDAAQFLMQFAGNGGVKSLDGEHAGFLQRCHPFGGYACGHVGLLFVAACHLFRDASAGTEAPPEWWSGRS